MKENCLDCRGGTDPFAETWLKLKSESFHVYLVFSRSLAAFCFIELEAITWRCIEASQ
jgi:hypothetical protein